MVEPGELSKVEAGHGFHTIIFRAEALVNHHIDQMEVLLLVKKNAILHPEFLSVAWAPSELLPLHLVLELFDGAENLLVGIEVLEHLLQHLIDVVVNPMPVLQFDDKVQGINVTQVLLANLDFLQVVEKHQHDSSDFLPTEKVKNF